MADPCRLALPRPAMALALIALAACASAPSNPEPAAPARQRAPAPSAPQASMSAEALYLCKMTVSNAPKASADRRLAAAKTEVALNGVRLLLAPATDSCLSSGYGTRSGKPHKGVDFFAATGGQALAASDGVILEAATRADYGNMLVIDHGSGVYTRYAHLATFARGVKAGARVRKSDALGPIGQTGAAGAPHLHYEILSGAYVSGVGAFGLTAHDPFALGMAKNGS